MHFAKILYVFANPEVDSVEEDVPDIGAVIHCRVLDVTRLSSEFGTREFVVELEILG